MTGKLIWLTPCTFLAVLALTPGRAAYGQTLPATQPADPPLSTRTPPSGAAEAGWPDTFVIDEEMPFRARLRNSGIFINAHHIPTPPEELIAALKESRGKKYITAIICRGDQRGSIQRYKPLADQFIIESLFMTPGSIAPKPGDLVWPNYDHPMINNLREFRALTEGRRLIAAIPMTTREIWGTPRTRPAFLEELRWMTLAAIGSNCQGVLWGHVRLEKWWRESLTRFQASLKANTDSLATASPVGWVRAADDQPVSALASATTLFVVLINPDYMKVRPTGDGISVPLEAGDRSGQLRIDPPAGCTIGRGASLSAAPPDLTWDGRSLNVGFRYKGGGTMLIFPLAWDHAGSQPVGRADETNCG